MTGIESHFVTTLCRRRQVIGETLLIQHFPVDKHFGLLRSLVDASAAIADQGEEDGQCG